MSAAELVASLREFQKGLTEEDRCALWAKIIDGYCDDCGRKLESPVHYCHCERDE